MKRILIVIVLLMLLGLYQTYKPKEDAKLQRVVEQIEENIGDNYVE